jgi:hypothetical protein
MADATLTIEGMVFMRGAQGVMLAQNGKVAAIITLADERDREEVAEYVRLVIRERSGDVPIEAFRVEKVELTGSVVGRGKVT